MTAVAMEALMGDAAGQIKKHVFISDRVNHMHAPKFGRRHHREILLLVLGRTWLFGNPVARRREFVCR